MRLLTLASSAEVRTFRAWMTAQITGQVERGADPVSAERLGGRPRVIPAVVRDSPVGIRGSGVPSPRVVDEGISLRLRSVALLGRVPPSVNRSGFSAWRPRCPSTPRVSRTPAGSRPSRPSRRSSVLRRGRRSTPLGPRMVARPGGVTPSEHGVGGLLDQRRNAASGSLLGSALTTVALRDGSGTEDSRPGTSCCGLTDCAPASDCAVASRSAS